RATTREVDENGVEKNEDAEKDFTIYPPQVVLKPHAQRSVRIQWMGDANLRREKAYRIIAEQLPVNLDKDAPHHSAVKFLVDYRAAAFVTPAGLAPDLKMESSDATTVNGKKMLELVFNNVGTQHLLLRNLKLDLKDNRGNEIHLTGDKQLKHIDGEGILAGHKRRFLLPWPKDLTGSLQTVDFTFDKQAF
ncbi:MAG: molecular chaperone, partial [Pseudomonadota bacterium]|nr:molecular chaperone [Pseudomonadota bacterium]